MALFYLVIVVTVLGAAYQRLKNETFIPVNFSTFQYPVMDIKILKLVEKEIVSDPLFLFRRNSDR